MIEKILGNKTAERVLLHVFHYGEIYATAIAKDYQSSVTPVKQQLERFEDAGVLVAKQVGRSRVFSFNEKSPLTQPVKQLLDIVYQSIPLKEREVIFKVRRRPRRKGKPVL